MPALLRRLIVVLLLASSAVSVAACETQDSGPLDALRAMPESHLAPFPGATLVREFSSPRRSGFLEATTGAYVLREFVTNANLSTVCDYYQTLLAPLGWSGMCGGRKNGYIFSIDIPDAPTLPSADQGYKLVYDEVLKEDTSRAGPPATGTP